MVSVMDDGPDQRRQAGEATDDAEFAGAIPDVYERLLVPLIFDGPAAVLAETVSLGQPRDVLETAAGTGVLTRALRARLPAASITATDLSEGMLAEAQTSSPGLPDVSWRQADAQTLPFEDASFDVVACQFGVMFFPDRHTGYLEARRVLRPGGRFVFTVWDSLDANQFPAVVHRVLAAAVPDSPPEFLSRTPYGYFDPDRLVADLAGAGFRAEVEVCDGVNRGLAQEVATAFCQGTPLRAELDARAGLGAQRATALVAESLASEFGGGVIEGRARWLQVVAAPSDGPLGPEPSATAPG